MTHPTTTTTLTRYTPPTPLVAQRTVLRHPTRPWQLDRTRQYDQRRGHGVGKPAGLYYAFGDAWLQWCRSNQYGDIHNGVLLPVQVQHPERVVQLRTAADYAAFGREYRDPTRPPFAQIRWGVVAALHAGLEFPRFDHSATLEHDDCAWAYGWDCDSGCIWDLEGAGVAVPA